MVEREVFLDKDSRIGRLPKIEQGFAAYLDTVTDFSEELRLPFLQAFSYDVRAASRLEVARDYGMLREELEREIEDILDPNNPNHALYVKNRAKFLAENKDELLDLVGKELPTGLTMPPAKQALAREPRPRMPKAIGGEVVYQKQEIQRYRRSQAEIDRESKERGEKIKTAILATAGVLVAGKPGERINMSELLRMVREAYGVDVTDSTLRIHYDALLRDHPELPLRQKLHVRPPSAKNHPWRRAPRYKAPESSASPNVDPEQKVGRQKPMKVANPDAIDPRILRADIIADEPNYIKNQRYRGVYRQLLKLAIELKNTKPGTALTINDAASRTNLDALDFAPFIREVYHQVLLDHPTENLPRIRNLRAQDLVPPET